jgi:MATE family multidrug resistance protein
MYDHDRASINESFSKKEKRPAEVLVTSRLFQDNNVEEITDFPSPLPLIKKSKLSYYHPEVKNPSCWTVKDPNFLSVVDDPPISKLSGKAWRAGLYDVFVSSLPICVTLMCNVITNFIMLFFVKSKGSTDQFDAIGLGVVFTNCTVIVLIYSVDQGLNALIAAAAGAKDHYLVGIYYQRGLFLGLCIVIPCCALLFLSDQILNGVGIAEPIPSLTSTYTQWMLPSVFGTFFYDATKAFLVGQNVFYPLLAIQGINTALHVLWCYIFVYVLNLDPLIGVAMARTVTEWLNFLGTVGYIKISKRVEKSWIPWTKMALDWDGIKAFMKITLPIGSILFLDWLCYEVFTVIAGNFDADQLMIQVAIANTSTLFYNIPLGLSVSAMTYVSNGLGARMVQRAKNNGIFALIIQFLILCVLFPILFFGRNIWASLFSDNADIQQDLVNCFYVYLIGILVLDSFQVILSGILKGIGQQRLATLGVLIGYYFIALPLIYLLAIYLDWKVLGIWIGFSSVIIVLAVLFTIVAVFTNWDTQLKLLRARLKEDTERAAKDGTPVVRVNH